MKVACCLLLVALLAQTWANEQLCAMSDELRETTLKCVAEHRTPEMKAKWDRVKQPYGSTDLEASKKLCQLRKEARESGAPKLELFTEEEKAAFKKVLDACTTAKP
ncbi:unnamed protein product [Ixodes pacificus]